MHPSRRDLSRRALALAATGACLLLPATPAAAGTSATDGTAAGAAGGWHRFHAQPFSTPAGALCPFPLSSHVLFDREYVRTTRTWPDGSPRTQEYAGPLVVRVTNTSAGRSVRRDLSGRAVVQHARDGSSTYVLQGPVAVGFHPGDSLPPGYVVLRGEHTVRFAADGTRTVTVDRGTEENLCETLR